MLTCSILTRAAAGPAAEVHDRTPVILPNEVQSAWIDPKQTDSEKALALLRTRRSLRWSTIGSSRASNNAKNQDTDLIQPFLIPA